MKAALLTIAALTALQPRLPSALEATLTKLDAYLADYEPKLSELVAEESMSQEIRSVRPRPNDPIQREERFRLRRQIESEVAFIALPDNRGWLGFRHVKTVNALPVPRASDSLSVLLQTPGLQAARELLTASAAHNLGLERTTNLPNLPLEFLHARNRKRLLPRIDGSETVRGMRATRLVFLERMRPTLISNPATGGDMPSVVKAWVENATGRLIRAEVGTFASWEAKSHDNNVRIEFTADRGLGLLVPSEMREEFAVVRPGTGTSVARYANFRRFTTSARIVPQ